MGWWGSDWESTLSTSGSNLSGFYMLVVNMQLTSSIWEDFQYLQNSSEMWLRIFSIALEEELKFLDFV